MSRPRLSFEFFPPKTLDASFRLWDAVRMLSPLGPEFVSVTYGAGGTTRKLTHEAVTTISSHYGLDVAAHLTCVDATRAETLEIAGAYADAGVRQIVALRGDPPKGAGGFAPHPDGFASSVELVEALAATGRFELRVGAYPEPHPEATDPAADIAWLKRKLAAGASSAITQFFFLPETFLRFRDACAKAGIDAPLIPGILPIESWTGVRKFAAACGAAIPPGLDAAFAGAATPEAARQVALDQCLDLCRGLLAEGVDHLHFYTLNRGEMTSAVCAGLGLAPVAVRAGAA